MLWFWTSLLAAAMWGLNYAAAEHGLKSGISGWAQMAFISWVTMPIFTFIAYKNGSIATSVNLMKENHKLLGWVALVVVCYIFGNIFIYSAIKGKNATSASLIEISYPLFIAFFAWAIFRHNQLSMDAVIGGAFILFGIGFMYVEK
ncbi:MAG: hypothetical protein JWM96_286 [Alphaproteobacteria bacterium]|nr:hypothetical protein [Alphaproteobacteria bacterium]